MGAGFAVCQEGQDQALQEGVPEEDRVTGHCRSHESRGISLIEVCDRGVLISHADVNDLSVTSENRVRPGWDFLELGINQKPNDDLWSCRI
jgi:hypothetical protein